MTCHRRAGKKDATARTKEGPKRRRLEVTEVQRRPPREREMAERQGLTAPLRPGSPERRTSRLRLLPPGPGQVRPINATMSPYEDAAGRPPAPRGGPSTGGCESYRQASPAHPEVADPSYSPFGGKGQGWLPALPAAARDKQQPGDKCVVQQKHTNGSRPTLNGLQGDETKSGEAEHQIRGHQPQKAEHRSLLNGLPPSLLGLHVCPQHMPPVERVYREHVH